MAGPCPGDFDFDGIPDRSFFLFLLAFVTASPSCDQNGDGDCTPADFTAWIAKRTPQGRWGRLPELIGAAVLLAACSILRWPVTYLFRWVRRQFRDKPEAHDV